MHKHFPGQLLPRASFLIIPLVFFLLFPHEPAFAKKGSKQPAAAQAAKKTPPKKQAARSAGKPPLKKKQAPGPTSTAHGGAKGLKKARAGSKKSAAPRPAAPANRHRHGVPPSVADRISAASAIVMDAESGEVLFAKEPDRPSQPASTIKVLTGLMALESLASEDTVPVSARAAAMPASKVDLKPGSTYQAGDLINAVLLASANDASVALAERIAGSEEKFAERMTCKARELGAANTICKTANGLTAEGQQTTVRDLAVIFNKAMARPEFAERVRQVTVKTREGKLLRNHNKALWSISGAQGGKTGFTLAARQTYVGKFQRGGDCLLVSVMGSGTMWSDVRQLVELGFNAKHRPALARLEPGDNPDYKPAKSANGKKAAHL